MSPKILMAIGIGLVAGGVVLVFVWPTRHVLSAGVVVAGLLIAAFAFRLLRLHSNELSLVFTNQPPYTVSDTGHGYRAEFCLGVLGSRRLPHDVNVLVTNIQPRPSSHLHFRAEYPYRLPQRGTNGDRELLVQLGAARHTIEGVPVFSGIQMDSTGEPDQFAMQRDEIWDVALHVTAADAKGFDAWISVAPDASGHVRVSRHDWKPATL
jgi:hypothetical protein